MQINDYRLDQELFKSFIGKTFNKYKHGILIQGVSTMSTVGLMIDNESYELLNDIEFISFTGGDDWPTICTINKKDWGHILDGKMIEPAEIEINKEIKEITLINDHYVSCYNGLVDYDWHGFRAVIFNFGDSELSLEKDICPNSDSIIIREGNNLIDKVKTGIYMLDGIKNDNEHTYKMNKEVINLSE